MDDQALTREELLDALAKCQAQVRVLQKALLEGTTQAGESRYQAIVEGQTDMVSRWLPDTTVTYVNKAYCDYFGHPVEEVLGSKFLPNLPEEAQQVVKASVKKLTSGQADHLITEELSYDAHGQPHWIQWTYGVVRDENGELIELQSVGRDVSRLHETREALERANLLVEQSPVVFFQRKIVDNKLDEILYVSENVKQYGYTAEDFTSGRVPFEQTVHPDDLQRVGEILIGNLANKVDEYELEYRSVLPGDRMVWFALQAKVERDEQGQAVLQQGTFIDYTERKQAEELLARRAQELATVAELGTAVSTVLEPEEMLQQVVDLTKERFELYHAHVYLLDESGETLVLRSGAGEVGRQMVAEKRSIPLAAEQSLVARAARTKLGVTVNDVRSDPDFLPHPLLPETRSELAVPLVVGSQVLGVLDVQSEQVGRFTEEDIRIQTTLASQVAVALQNAEQYTALGVIQKQLDDASDIAALAYWELDIATLTFLFNDDIYKRILHITAEEAGGYLMPAQKFASTYMHPDDAPLVQSLTQEALETDDPNYENSAEVRYLCGDGKERNIFMRFRIIKDAEGNTIRTYGTNQDITARKQAEAELQQSEERFRSLVSNITGAVYRCALDADYTMYFISEPIQTISGYPAEDFIGNKERTYASIIHPEDLALVDETISKTIETREPYYIEYRIVTADGSERWVSEGGRVVFTEGDQVDWLDGAIFDITERKQAEELLAWRAQELATVAELGTAVSTVLEPEEMLQQVVDLTKERFELYHAHVYLLDESGETLLLRSGAGEVGRQMVAEKRSIPLAAEQSLVARAARTKLGVTVNDVRSDPDFLPHPLLPETRSELAVPLVVGSQVLGVLDVQSEQVGRFTEEDIRIQTTLASQVAVALQNARQYELSRQSEALVRSIIDGIPDWIFLKDTQYRFMMVNKSFADAMHLSFAEMHGKTDLEVGFPEELVMGDPEKGIAGFRVDDQRVIETGETYIITDDVVQVDGEEKILYTTKSPLRDASGEVIGMLGIGRDVSELRQASQQLKEALEIASLAYWEFDVAKGSFLFNNDYYQRILHTTAEKAGGYWMPAQKFAMEYVNPEDAASVPVKIQEALQAEDSNYEGFTEARLRGGDGKERNILMRMRIVKDAEGNTVKLYGTNQDITDRKQAEFELQQSEERFRSLVSNITGAVYRCALDADYTMYFISEPIQAISGYPAEDFIGNKERTYASIIHPEDLALVDEAINKTIETREPYYIEYRIVTADGSERWVSEGGRVVFTEGDQVDWLDGAIFDITERKQAEELLARRAQELATVAELGTAVSTVLEPEEMLQQVVDLTKERFELYHAHVYLLDESGETLLLRSGAGEVGRQMVAEKRSIPLAAEQSLVARAARTKLGVTVNDVRSDPDFLPHSLLPETRSELAVPLVVGNQVLGVLDVQSEQVGRFTEEDIRIQTTLASQVAVALQNARQYEQVNDSEKLIRTIIDSTPDWIFVKDLDHRYVMVNEGYGKSLHIAPEDFIGKNDIDLGFPEELVKGNPEKGIRGFWADDRQIFETDAPIFFENDIVQIDGQRRIYSTLKTPLHDADGKVSGVLAFARDVTEREEAEARLAEALDIATLAYWEFDVAKGSFLFNDDYYQRILHTTAEKAGGYLMPAQTFAMEYVNPEDAASVPVKIQEALQAEDPNYEGFAEARLRGGDGKERNILMRMRIVKNAEGNTIKLYGTNQDVTESKQAELELIQSEERLRTLIDAVPDMIFRFDAAGKFVDFKGAEGGTYVPPEVFLGKKYSEVLPPHVAALTKEALEKGAAEKKTQTFEYQLPNEAGEQDIFEARIITGETGEAVGLIRNVTEQRTATVLLSKRAQELATVAELGTAVSTVLDPEEMLQAVVELTKERFELYHAHVYLLDESGETLVLRSGAGEVGRQMVAEKRSIPLAAEQSLVARAARTKLGVTVNDVRSDPDFLPHPLLPETRSELAVPLVVGSQVLGVLDVQSEQAGRFTEEDIRIQTTLASQVAVALQNARQFEEISRLGKIVETSQDGMVITTMEGIVEFANQAMAKMHGYEDAKDLIGKPLMIFQTEEQLQEVMPLMAQMMESPEGVVAEVGHVRRDGTEFATRMMGQVLRNDDGVPYAVVTGIQDITARKQAEAELQQSEERFRSLVSNITGAVYRCALDADYTMYFISEPIQTISGYPAEDFIGNKERTYASIIHPEDLALVDETISKTIETREPYFIEYRIRTADGSERWVSEGGRVVFTEGDQVNWLDGAIFDITERKQAEVRLAEALDIATLAYWEFDVAKGSFLFNDDYYQRILHTTAEKAGGYWMPAQTFAMEYVNPQDAASVPVKIQEALQAEDPNYEGFAEARLRGGDGKERNVLMRMRIIKNAEGKTLRLYGTNQDVTESKQAEELLARRARELATVAELGTAVSTVLEPEEMLQQVVDLTKERFELYHAHVYLLDESGETLLLRSGAGEVGRQMVAEKRSIPLAAEQSLVARAARTKLGVTVNDVRSDPDFLPHPLLPETRSELAVPLVVGNQVLGVLDVQSEQVGRFTEEDIRIQTTLASQVAVALQNARQYEQVRQSEQLVRTMIDSTSDWIFVKDLDHRYVLVNKGYADSLHITPEDFIGKNDIDLGFPEELVKGNPEKGIRGFWADDRQVFETNAPLTIENDVVMIDGKERNYSTVKTPLRDANDKVIGVLAFGRDVTEREELLKETRSQAEQEALINAISQKIQATTTVENALQVAIRELGQSLGAKQTSVRLGVDKRKN